MCRALNRAVRIAQRYFCLINECTSTQRNDKWHELNNTLNWSRYLEYTSNKLPNQTVFRVPDISKTPNRFEICQWDLFVVWTNNQFVEQADRIMTKPHIRACCVHVVCIRCSCFRLRRTERHFQWTQTHTLIQSSKRNKWLLRAPPSGRARLQSQVLTAAFYRDAGHTYSRSSTECLILNFHYVHFECVTWRNTVSTNLNLDFLVALLYAIVELPCRNCTFFLFFRRSAQS